ncbi:hypothetical protein BIW11_12185 [Tropilaelaps mercedesae]|uniref:Uncharacterized protein n=1 Tax=Tropilaelaps mercedesae TaxID=418985 RepID=A0A1V9X8D8_9ACAR|nr:hypothetical protein BIW11_12185 [Tropilaelaps mercedesae]
MPYYRLARRLAVFLEGGGHERFRRICTTRDHRPRVMVTVQSLQCKIGQVLSVRFPQPPCMLRSSSSDAHQNIWIFADDSEMCISSIRTFSTSSLADRPLKIIDLIRFSENFSITIKVEVVSADTML